MFNAVFEKNAVRNRLLLITDLAKTFDCIDHELLTAKLHAYGFDIKSLKFIDSYLAGRKQKVKTNASFSKWGEVYYGVPQGSILVCLCVCVCVCVFVCVCVCDCVCMCVCMFFSEIKIDYANYTDDTTPYICKWRK